jgi:hypothetical protein
MAEKKETRVQDNKLHFYEQLRKVPQEALKPIAAGRLKGKSDINPVWRIKAMTEAFGPCGIGWKYEITKQWQDAYGQEVKAFTNINLYIKVDGEWSEPIPGTGGATIVELGKSGAYVNDEGFKMSLTDALSVSMKALGVAADVYFAADASKSQYETKYEQQSYVAQQGVVQQPIAQPQVMFGAQVQGEIGACNDTNALLAIWNKYPSLQQDARFSGAITAKKDQIMNNGKS